MSDPTPNAGPNDTAIMLLWPGRLERCMNGHQRKTVRKAYKRFVKFEALKESGATCRTCYSYDDPKEDESLCNIECDWQTTCHTQAGELCLKWGPRRPDQENGT